jgi:hypothetical protein
MHLLYLDESGKSGPRDFTQPFYVLGGQIVHEKQWIAMESDLNAQVDWLVPPPRDDTWKLRGVDLHHGKAAFKQTARRTREALTDAVFNVIERHSPTVIVVAIDKAAHHRQYVRPDPVEEVAYLFMLERFDAYLRHHDDSFGLVVSDQQKEVEAATRRAHSRYRREGTRWQTIERVIETPFFTPSHWSRMLQATDVVTYWAARYVKTRGSSHVFHPHWDRIDHGLTVTHSTEARDSRSSLRVRWRPMGSSLGDGPHTVAEINLSPLVGRQAWWTYPEVLWRGRAQCLGTRSGHVAGATVQVPL